MENSLKKFTKHKILQHTDDRGEVWYELIYWLEIKGKDQVNFKSFDSKLDAISFVKHYGTHIL
jgi:hypothetical protein